MGLRFEVQWTKGYYMSGIVEVEADHEDDAYDEVMKNIGDYTGSLQYDEYGESVEIIKEIKSTQLQILSGEGSDVLCKCETSCNKTTCPCYNVLCDDEICQKGEGCEYRDCIDGCTCKCEL